MPIMEKTTGTSTRTGEGPVDNDFKTDDDNTIKINRSEKGHRLGNFHNYYTFNPSSNRIVILQRLNVIRYLQKHLGLLQEEDSEEDAEEDAEEDNGYQRQHKRIKVDSITLSSSVTNNKKVITYCDLGCNEGDLTISVAQHLIQSNNSQMNSTPKYQNNKKTNDIKTIQVGILGLDIDDNLIQRANTKYTQHGLTLENNNHNNDINKSSDNNNINATFQTCNIANNKSLISKCTSFLHSFHQNQNYNHIQQPQLQPRFDVISMFSTTMWIHIHHGDTGLQALLQTICTLCNYIIIEPQPSKCYRSVNIRLRKMNVEEIDVSLDRLKMRKDIEIEIDEVIVNCGFERVTHCDLIGDDDDNNINARNNCNKDSNEDHNGYKDNKDERQDRTSWNRSLRLYKRKHM